MSGARVSVWLAVLVSFLAADVHAHPLAPSVLSLTRGEDEVVTMTWRAPIKRPTGQSLRPRIPQGCEPVGPPGVEALEDGTAVVETTKLRCAAADLVGVVVAVDGFEDSSVNVVVRVVSPDGDVHHTILDAGTPTLTITANEGERSSFASYLALGVEHLLTGWDHLTFVIGLLILFGWRRRLIAAVTAFTIGHSITLALSVLGIVSVPQALVEALIAWTIVVLALEIQSGRRGPVWTHPWTLPGALGLLHGLGFASVLFDAGLPAEEIPVALLGFNLGLELGQLGVIAVAWVAFRLVRPFVPETLRGNRTVPAYVIGSLAAFWVLERTLAAFGIAV